MSTEILNVWERKKQYGSWVQEEVHLEDGWMKTMWIKHENRHLVAATSWLTSLCDITSTEQWLSRYIFICLLEVELRSTCRERVCFGGCGPAKLHHLVVKLVFACCLIVYLPLSLNIQVCEASYLPHRTLQPTYLSLNPHRPAAPSAPTQDCGWQDLPGRHLTPSGPHSQWMLFKKTKKKPFFFWLILSVLNLWLLFLFIVIFAGDCSGFIIHF